MSDIPTDAWREILVRLPAKSLIRCRAVSKAFRAVIDDQSFAKAYTKKQLSSNTSSTNVILRNSAGPPFHPLCSFDLDALNFDGSSLQTISATPLDFTHGRRLALPVAACDGLMLVAPETRQENWQIWNPSTHESLDLPQLDIDFLEPLAIAATGLGFDESTDDYKAVVISRSECYDIDEYLYLTHVYSLKSDSWRTITEFPSNEFDGPKGPGAFMGGALNWFFAPYEKPERIVALDLRTETYRELKLPSLPERPFATVQQSYLDVLDSGRLVLTDFGCLRDPERERENFDVWVMKDYEVEDSWVRLFSVEGEGDCAVTGNCYYGLRHVAFLSNKLQFLFQDCWVFHLFDVQTSCVKSVYIQGIGQISLTNIQLDSTLSAQVVPESIFRLHENCGVGGRKRMIMKREEGSKSNVHKADLEIKFCVGDEIEWNIF